MTPQAISASYNEREINQQYLIILAKLQGTVAKHKVAFPQLLIVEEFLNVDLPEANRDRDYVNRLEEICSFLNELSSDSYIFRHLHHYFCVDVELVKNKTFYLFNQQDSYLVLPK